MLYIRNIFQKLSYEWIFPLPLYQSMNDMNKIEITYFSDVLTVDELRRLELFFSNNDISDNWKTILKQVIENRGDDERTYGDMEIFFANTNLAGLQRKILVDIIGV